jgi:DNA ligase-1
MLLTELVTTSARAGATASRLEKRTHLVELLQRVRGDEIEIAVAYLSGRLRQGRIGLGGATIGAALQAAPALEPTLMLDQVDRAFSDIARLQGAGSAAARRERLGALFARATREEQTFLARLITGELRQGALEGAMIEAIADAAAVPARDVRRAVMVAGDLPQVAQAALTEGLGGLSRFALQLLQPVSPMLAQTADDVDGALAQLGRAGWEYKLDGARVQVHKQDGDVRVYTRKLNDVTEAVPEVVEVTRRLPARGLILDGEAIALRPDRSPQPFQVTMRRFGRRLDVAALRETLPLSVFFFDCLHAEGEDLIDQPAAVRFSALESSVPAFLRIPRRVTGEPAEAEAFLDEALRHGHEGLMAKALEAPYEAGNRGSSWLKLKPAHTLDLVVLAAEWGHGRRQGWLSNLHLGARDPEGGGFVMLGKTFKGMTDALLAWQTEALQQLALGSDGYAVHVRPELVVEVAFNDVQESPHYPGGLALRFARVKRYRPDKTAAEADTIDTVRGLYLRQRERGRTNVPAETEAVM